MPVPSEPCRECGAIDEVSELIAFWSPNGEVLLAISTSLRAVDVAVCGCVCCKALVDGGSGLGVHTPRLTALD